MFEALVAPGRVCSFQKVIAGGSVAVGQRRLTAPGDLASVPGIDEPGWLLEPENNGNGNGNDNDFGDANDDAAAAARIGGMVAVNLVRELEARSNRR